MIQNYDNPESTFLINVDDLLDAIEIDFSPLDTFYKKENDETITDEDYANDIVRPGPGKRGGRAIVFPCRGYANGNFNITMTKVNNMEPYFNLNSMGLYGLVPLLEIWSIFINERASTRGQYFSYKMVDGAFIKPFVAVSAINYNSTYLNRYGGKINLVGSSHCEEGDDGQITKIFPAKEKQPTSQGGKSKGRTSVKTRKVRNKHKNYKKRATRTTRTTRKRNRTVRRIKRKY